MDVRFSIIIPHYNDYYGFSRLMQSLPNDMDIQIIVVDDNSDDDILSDLERYVSESGLNISLFFNDSGLKGAGAARNIGLAKAIGKYVIFADSDDFFVENAFNTISSTLDGNMFDVYFFKPTSRCLVSGETSDRHIFYTQLIDSYLTGENQDVRYKFYVPWSKIYLREYIERHNFKFDQVIASNDVMFSLKSALNARISVSDKTFYCVTRGVGTLTVNVSRPVLQARLKVSLEESKYFYDKKIDVEKYSALALIRRSRFKISYQEIKHILYSYRKGYINLLPEGYVGMFKNPMSIIKKLVKRKSSVNDKKYRA